MCTVSWVHHRDGYELLCNRDEKLTRTAAKPPCLFEQYGVRFLAPVDTAFGGTWLAVNQFGTSLCLLNGPGPAPKNARSRGLLVWELVPQGIHALKHRDLSFYAPFTLLMLEPGKPAMLGIWDGARLEMEPGDPHMPLTSSSQDPDGVRRSRLNQFARRPGSLHEFHAGHGDGPSAYSACMHRPDAETVSYSHITVTRNNIRFSYVPGSPCRALRSAA